MPGLRQFFTSVGNLVQVVLQAGHARRAGRAHILLDDRDILVAPPVTGPLICPLIVPLFEMLLMNILTNAMKYNASGKPRHEAEKSG